MRLPLSTPLAALLAAGLLAGAGAAAAQGVGKGVPSGAGSELAAALSALVPGVPQGVAEVRLLPGWVEPGGSHMAAIDIRLEPGWHTYWRLPGEAGIPPVMDWSGSRNLAAVAYQWPRPHLFETRGVRSFGHEGALTLPVRLTAENPRAPVEARLALFFGVCRDICVPAEATLAVRLDPALAPQNRTRIAAALDDAPLTPAAAGVRAVTCTLSPRAAGPELSVEVGFADPLVRPQAVVVETGVKGQRLGRVTSETRGATVTGRARLVGAAALDRRHLRVTVVDATRAVEIWGCASRPE